MRYCGPECQSVDWPNHKPECAALRRWAAFNEKEGGKLGIAPDESVRGMARLIWKRKKMGVDSIWSKQIHGMKSHPFVEKDAVRILALWRDLMKYMCPRGVPEDLPSLLIPNEDTILELISQFTDNNFALYNQTLYKIGICCSPLAALLNHSCDSNLSPQYFTTPAPETEKTETAIPEPAGLIMDLVAFRYIAAGDEITMSYTPTSHSTAQRRKALERNFAFICKCPICEPQMHGRTDMDWRETLICPQNCGGACPIPDSEAEYPAKCTMCGVFSNVDPASLPELRKLGEEALKKANELDFSCNWDEGIAIARGAIALLEPILTPCTEPLYELCSLQQSMLFQSIQGLDPDQPTPSGPYNELAHVASLNVFAVQKLFRPGDPERAKTLADAGCVWALTTNTFDPTAFHEINLDLQLQRLAKAKSTMLQALEELQWGWGKKRDGGSLSFMVRKGLARAERDLKQLGEIQLKIAKKSSNM